MEDDIRDEITKFQDPMNLGWFADLTYDLEERQEEGRRYYVLKSMDPVQVGEQSFDDVTIWINADNYLPFRMEMTIDADIKPRGSKILRLSQTMKQEFVDWNLDAEIDDTIFTFVPPPEVKVIDQTQQIENYFRSYQESKENN